MAEVFEIKCQLTINASEPLDSERVTDIVEVIIDELDSLATDPSVSTAGAGEQVVMTVGVVSDQADMMDAFVDGVTAIRSALHAAGISTGGLVELVEFRPSVRPALQHA